MEHEYYAELPNGNTIALNSPDEIIGINELMTDEEKALYPGGYQLTAETLQLLGKQALESRIDKRIEQAGYSSRKQKVTTSNGSYIAFIAIAALIIQTKEPNNTQNNDLIDNMYLMAQELMTHFQNPDNIGQVIPMENVLNDVIKYADDVGVIVKDEYTNLGGA